MLVARYAGHEELVEKVTAAIEVHQSKEEALVAGLVFSAILERMALLGASIKVKLCCLALHQAWTGLVPTLQLSFKSEC